ncbi:hypothetical protein TIFTF001_032482 [Ficus carica]|uniref:Uncharacterized protein n=1 Tax=Ficus carica TaxID=3494 RepID=A0AA88E3J0_FICCA|nr:hypothetical protein TIFTF001_032482 [Ficus carica]
MWGLGRKWTRCRPQKDFPIPTPPLLNQARMGMGLRNQGKDGNGIADSFKGQGYGDAEVVDLILSHPITIPI